AFARLRELPNEGTPGGSITTPRRDTAPRNLPKRRQEGECRGAPAGRALAGRPCTPPPVVDHHDTPHSIRAARVAIDQQSVADAHARVVCKLPAAPLSPSLPLRSDAGAAG